MPRFVKYALPALLWMVFIFCMSTDSMSAETTRSAVDGIFARFLPGVAAHLSAESLDRIDWNIRKAAHVTEYAVLGILLYRAVVFGNPRFRDRHVVLPFLLGVGYAASDEFHQGFTRLRGPRPADVFFDMTGVLIGLVLCLWHRASRSAVE